MFLSVPGGDNQLLEEDLYSDDDNEEGSTSIYEVQPAASPKSQLSSSATHRPFLHFSSWVDKKCLKYTTKNTHLLIKIQYIIFPKSHQKVGLYNTRNEQQIVAPQAAHVENPQLWNQTG